METSVLIFIILIIVVLTLVILTLTVWPHDRLHAFVVGGTDTKDHGIASEKSLLVLPTTLVDVEFIRKYKISKVILCSLPYYYDRLPFHKLKLAYLHAVSTKYTEYLKSHDIIVIITDKIVPADYAVDPIDEEPRKQLINAGIVVLDSPSFILSHNEAMSAEHPHDKFYKNQRIKLRILHDGKSPVGGQYSFDTENRSKFQNINDVKAADAEVRECAKLNAKIKAEACNYINKKYPNNYGVADATNFVFPIDREEAKHMLDLSMKHLPNFGKYQDAVHPDIAFGYHSVLSAAINVGLIDPRVIVDRAIAEYNSGRVSLSSVEAFIRQIIGWREYVRSVYVREADKHRNSNYYGGDQPIPPQWYTANTGIEIIDAMLARVNKYAYAHHIERLMFLCAVLNMMGCSPTAITDWFMTCVAIDAYDWVMVPNITMGTYRINTMTKRPYFSGYSYVKSMTGISNKSDEQQWNDLYHGFLRKHYQLHQKNYFTARQLRLIK